MPRRLTRLAVLAAAACLLWAAPAQAEKRALILAISNYVRQPLPGVAKDIENASDIARLMGVPDQNIEVRRDAELAGPGLLRALDEFTARVRPEDQVFVYYSGHGSSYSKRGAPGVCEKALVAQDITFVPKEEFHRRLNALAAKAEKTFVFMDSCYSGGLVQLKGSRSLGLGGGEARPKFTAASPADPCSVPSNVVRSARDLDMVVAERQPNYYLLGSAAENEVAIDGGPALGGYASSALLQCLQSPEQADRNGDVVVSHEEAKLCAQDVVNKRLAQGRESSPDFAYSSMTLTSGYGQGGNTPLVFVGTKAQPVNTPAFVQSLYDGRDGRRSVALAAPRNPVRIGEELKLVVESDRPGYLTLMVVGSSGRIFKIFPNQLDTDAKIEPGTALFLPRPGVWRLPASPPAGDNWILALVSDTPDRFKDLGQQAGIFRDFGNDEAGSRGIFDFLLGLLRKAASGDQQEARQKPENGAGSAYGAALLKVTETY